MSPVKVTRGGWRPSGVAAERRTANGVTVGKAARTRAIILDAARAEFDRRGFAATTVEHIVERAGVAWQLLHLFRIQEGSLRTSDRADRPRRAHERRGWRTTR